MNKVKSIDIELLRNNHIESKHEVLITTDKDQDGFKFFPRSAIKPFQIIPLLLLAKKKQITFESEEIAIFGSSHSGQDIHVNLLTNIAKKFNINSNDIFCAPQRPMHVDTADQYISNKLPFTKLNTPAGKPASCIISAKSIPDNGAISEGFKIIVQPVAKAGITLSAIWFIGQFQGVIRPQTPIGS